MSAYTRQLAALTDEEQAIYRQYWIEPEDNERLKAIEAERAYLWNLERARRAGQDESAVPREGWRVDTPNGWSAMHHNGTRARGRPVTLLIELESEDAYAAD